MGLSLALALALCAVHAASAYDCSAHPWVDEAVKHWFKPAYKMARQSPLTVEESLGKIANITWYGGATRGLGGAVCSVCMVGGWESGCQSSVGVGWGRGGLEGRRMWGHQ